MCDVASLEVCDVLLGQPYMWKCHVVYESRPRSVIVTLGNQLYRIPEAMPKTIVSLITTKQCRKVISQKLKLVLFMYHSKGEKLSQQHPPPVHRTPLCSINRWTRSWKHTKTSSLHLSRFQYNIMSSVPLI